MKNMWDDRYSVKEYIYGKEANDFFRDQLDQLAAGRMLLPGEGEGRNAVYAACKGWEVVAFDISVEGQNKCFRLAKEMGVNVNYHLSGYSDFNSEQVYDAIGLFFTHQPSEQTRIFHKRIQGFLKSGGTMLIEGFHKEQVNYDSGGPGTPNFLYSSEELQKDFEGFEILRNEKVIRSLSEGSFHQGKAALVQFVAVKK